MTDDDRTRYAEGEFYLVMQGTPNRYSPAREPWILQGFKVYKQKPAVERDQIAMKIKVRIPSALFRKPTLSATIGLDGEVPELELDASTTAAIEDVIRSQLGLDVSVSVVPPDED